MEQQAAEFYEVHAGSEDMRGRVHRFSGTKRGFVRAKEYARNYNESLRKAMGLTEDDLGLKIENVDLNNPDQYDKAQSVESYWDHSATVTGVNAVPVIGDDDPMPTDYPHDF